MVILTVVVMRHITYLSQEGFLDLGEYLEDYRDVAEPWSGYLYYEFRKERDQYANKLLYLNERRHSWWTLL